MSKECNCGSVRSHALAVSSAIFQSLLKAGNDPDRENHWRKHADLLEQKFNTAHGRHYSYFIDPVGLPKDCHCSATTDDGVNRVTGLCRYCKERKANQPKGENP